MCNFVAICSCLYVCVISVWRSFMKLFNTIDDKLLYEYLFLKHKRKLKLSAGYFSKSLNSDRE